jgi:hypothetical protein
MLPVTFFIGLVFAISVPFMNTLLALSPATEAFCSITSSLLALLKKYLTYFSSEALRAQKSSSIPSSNKTPR